jgi:putative ABC transport system permease protein
MSRGSRLFQLPWRTHARVRADVDDELRFHFEMHAQELSDTGLTPDAAWREAVRQFGDVEYTRRYCRTMDQRQERAMRWSARLEDLIQDIRFAVRQLRRHAAFTIVAILTLALGIGATSAIFSVVDGVLLKPLPYADASRIVRVNSFKDGSRYAVSPLDYQDWRAQSTSFSEMASINDGTVTLTATGAEPSRFAAGYVAANTFRLLGTRPIMGRAFLDGEDQQGAAKVVMLSEEAWRDRFGADRGILGRSLTLDGVSYTVIGIIPRNLAYPLGEDLWIPDVLPVTSRGARWLRVIARLKPGITVQHAQAEMSQIAKRLETMDPDHNLGMSAQVVPLQQQLVGNVRTPLLVLLASVALVMLIACANVANLLLVRAAARETEIAVRTALGAGRPRLVRQLLTESVLLSIIGGFAGIALAFGGTRAFVALAPSELPRIGEVRVDTTVLFFAIGVALITGLVFGLIPALQASSFNVNRALKEGGRGAITRPGSARARNSLVISELALAVILLAGAGLLIRSFLLLSAVDPGFRAEQVITYHLSLPDAKYDSDEKISTFTSSLIDRMRHLPGVTHAALVAGLPLTGSAFSLSFTVAGRPPSPADDKLHAQIRPVTDDYFATLGIPVQRGRGFTSSDRAGSAGAMVATPDLVRRFFPNEEVLGKHIELSWRRSDKSHVAGGVVGVVGDVKNFALDADPQPMLYVPFDQFPRSEINVVVRSNQGVGPIGALIRREVRALDPDLPVYGLQPLEHLVEESLATPRFYVFLLGTFAVTALLLAAVGIYGVISYTVTQRTQEIGIRVALGASREQVMRMVVGQGLRVTLVGLGIGAVGALLGTRLMRTLLFGVTPADPLTFFGVTVVLLAVAIAASYLPARRAAAADPLIAMRRG